MSEIGSLSIVLLLILLIGYLLSKPREKVVGKATFSEVGILPDGTYQVLFDVLGNHVALSLHVSEPGQNDKLYYVHKDGMPRTESGGYPEYLIKQEGKLL